MKKFVTADHHFHHRKFVELRGFKNDWDMHNEMIEAWNKKVSRDDTVYHLGDFSLGNKKEIANILNKLNGHIILVRGNHDRYAKKKHRFMDIVDYKEIKYLDKNIIMCHYPFETWNKKHYGSIHLHGHSHGQLRVIENRIDVGVDKGDGTFNFSPINLDEIMEFENVT
ncbi:MAG: phosphoesterase [Acidobacteria bacterium]|nr:phosphoesterase [Acidobacteriota bacterium]|tara:strand:- start:2987 stop:3490 length:504 start_codon:yes stop_codon:yes gene_type:complete